MNSSIKKVSFLSLSVIASLSLISCSVTSKEPASASYRDLTANSEYGKISDYNLQNGEELKEGDVLEFKVTPSEDFLIDKVTVNGEDATPIENKTNYYSYTLKAGVNRISATYKIDTTIDFVSKFKLNISDKLFQEVMDVPDGATQADPTAPDFRQDGIEKINMNGFINYVDGDTTHVETLNYGYTVKIRYLGIDTPESTSEIEKWGKSASNFNKEILSNAKHIILEGQGVAKNGEKAPATADGNQRSLAYVWYTDVEQPTKADFRCLNLEMVYNGYSFGIGSKEEMGDYFYSYFDKASKSAEARKLHVYSDDNDPNYYDWEKNPVQELTLKKLYESSANGPESSIFANTKNQALYKISGYVSRKLETAFYIQDKAEYTRGPNGELPEAYGIYVFTYANTPIQEGDYVEVIGAITTYGGSYQMQGISYHTINPDPRRDTIIKSSGHKIVPLEVSYEEFYSTQFSNTNKLNNVLITLEEEIYPYVKTNSYGSMCEGGTMEINKYNEKYPFYNTNNKIICYAKYGSSNSNQDLRFVSSEEVLLDYQGQTALSYQFFTGGTNIYNPHGAEYANTNEDNPYKDETITTTYQPKKMKVTAISQYYVSTSGSTTMYSAIITNKADVVISTY